MEETEIEKTYLVDEFSFIKWYNNHLNSTEYRCYYIAEIYKSDREYIYEKIELPTIIPLNYELHENKLFDETVDIDSKILERLEYIYDFGIIKQFFTNKENILFTCTKNNDIKLSFIRKEITGKEEYNNCELWKKLK